MEHHKGETEHWNCTGCKQDVGRHGIRHKYAGGVFCVRCLRGLGVGPRRGGFFSGLFGFFHDVWDFVTDIVQSPFQLKQQRKMTSDKMKVQATVMKAKAMNIPPNPMSGSPQKR